MRLNAEQAVALLVSNINKIHVERVLAQLESEPPLQLVYLDHLFFKTSEGNQNNQEASEFHNLQVGLAVLLILLSIPFLFISCVEFSFHVVCFRRCLF
jgi:hypothetical protein